MIWVNHQDCSIISKLFNPGWLVCHSSPHHIMLKLPAPRCRLYFCLIFRDKPSVFSGSILNRSTGQELNVLYNMLYVYMVVKKSFFAMYSKRIKHKIQWVWALFDCLKLWIYLLRYCFQFCILPYYKKLKCWLKNSESQSLS